MKRVSGIVNFRPVFVHRNYAIISGMPKSRSY